MSPVPHDAGFRTPLPSVLPQGRPPHARAVGAVGLVLVSALLAGCASAAPKPAELRAVAPSQAPSPAAVKAEPEVFACVSSGAGGMCTEAPRSDQDSARCAGAGAQERRGRCPQDAVIASCTLPNAAGALYIYEAPGRNAERTRGVVRGLKSACEVKSGTFHLAAPATVVSCKNDLLCHQVTVFPDDAQQSADALNKCLSEGDKGFFGPCPRVQIVAACTFEDSRGLSRAVVAYPQADAKMTETVVRRTEAACGNHEGKFVRMSQ